MRFFRALFKRVDEDRCFEVAGSLTYSTLLALVPMLTIALSVAAALPYFTEWTGRIDKLMVDNNDVIVGVVCMGFTPYIATFLGDSILGATTFTTSLWPKDGVYVLPLKDVVRRAERIDLGDEVDVRIHIDL